MGRTWIFVIATFTAACGRIGFDEGNTVTQRWTFETVDDLSFDPSELASDAGQLRLVARDQVDDDDSSTGFGGGTSANLRWNPSTNMLELSGGNQGVHRSRVFDAGGVVSWAGLRWLPERPSGKPLPDDASETGYPVGNFDRSEVRLLMHMDESSGTTIRDTSGHDNDGVNINAEYAAPGRFGTSLDLGGTAEIGAGTAPSLSLTGDLSVSLWVKRNAISDQFLISKEANPVLNGWCVFFTTTGQLTFCTHDGTTRNTSTTATFTSTTTWYHVAVTHTIGAQRIYVNGVAQPLQNGGGFMTNPAISGNPMVIGRRYTNNAFLEAFLDEVVVVARTLSAAEVLELYYRGATRLRFQVRSCSEPTCSGIPFVGPGGSTTTYFTETAVAGTPSLPITATEAPPNRYFQYELTFDTDAAESPRVLAVGIEPEHLFAGPATVTHHDVVTFDRLVGFREITGTGSVRYQASPDGLVWYHRVDDAWVVASNLADASSAEEIDAGCATFAEATNARTFYWRAILQSADGVQQVALDEISVSYVF